MKVLSVFCLILTGILFTNLSYGQAQNCAEFEKQKRDAQQAVDDAVAERAKSWTEYTSNCGAGGATSSKGEKGGRGSGNMCFYKSGSDWRYVYKDNTIPVPNCEDLTCYDANAVGYILGALSYLTEAIGIADLLSGLVSSSSITNQCLTSCKTWHEYNGNVIPGLERARDALNATEICTSPCRGLPDEAYRKCECERKDQKIWTWDESKDPKACVACKSKEGKGEEYNKCMCENVQEGIWDSEEKNCYGKSCAGKTGDDYKKCICEVEKRGVWDTKKKMCNYIPDPNGGGSIVPPGPSDTGVEDAGAGYTAEGAAGAGMSDSSSFGGGGSSGFGLDKDSGKTGSKTKKSGGPWYKNLLGAMGFGGMGSYGGGSNTTAGVTEGGRKVTPYSDKKVEVKKPTDIGASSGDDIFEQITKTLDKNYRSATIGAPVAKGAGSL